VAIYCENSLRATIYFSLTGGREGKIISDNPPVNVGMGDVNIYEFDESIYDEFNSKQTTISNILRLVFPVPVRTFIEGHEIIEFSAGGGERDFNTLVVFTYAIRKKYFQNNYFEIDRVTTNTTFLPRSETYSSIVGRQNLQSNIFYIQDARGSLYSQIMPAGFNVSYSVKCDGCAAGECAGSNGKGGVICMDCKEISASLNRMKNTLR
jgi:hypothetical protein